MACLINSSLALDCISSLGGLKTAYFLAGEITSTTAVAGEITDIVGNGSFYEYQLAKDTAFYNEAINVSNTSGTIYYEGVLTIVLQKMKAEYRNQILLLAQNRDLRIAFVDNNDTTWIMALQRGAVMSASNAATGTAVADMSGYTLSFTCQEPAAAQPLAAGDTLADVVTGITVVPAV